MAGLPSVTRLFVVSLLVCAGLPTLSCANSVDVQVRASVAATQALFPVVDDGGGSVDETAAYSPRAFSGNLLLLTVDLSNAEWIPELGTSAFTLQTVLVVEVRSNVPWRLSAELSTVPVLGRLKIRVDEGPTIALNASTTEIHHGDPGVHTLYLQLHAGNGIPQEELDAVSLILLLRAVDQLLGSPIGMRPQTNPDTRA